MKLKMFQVDAFASRVFEGNPAAVVPLERWLPDDVMQRIAMENNLSETAYFVPASGDDTDFDLRWFTPLVEMDLCGHATLASAHVLSNHLKCKRPKIKFSTRSGLLMVGRAGNRLVLDFPARGGEPHDVLPELVDAIGDRPVEMRVARDWMAVFETADQVRNLQPDMTRVSALDTHALIVTAPGDTSGVDFVSRFFAPKGGVPEDPVTGSAHCTLIPYWAKRLGKSELHAQQISARGGELFCTNRPDTGRVLIAGQAVTFMEGAIYLP